nr:MAG TPA: hypothetical protein [Caudoviricetes sp.]
MVWLIILFCFSISCLQLMIISSLFGMSDISKSFSFSSNAVNFIFASCNFLSFKFVFNTSFLL